ncbi:MAG: hypothetical protein FWC86_05600 [Coriobacteriia bacterium]|nr:hypothetical protein [Coriobacteriia bacterium]
MKVVQDQGARSGRTAGVAADDGIIRSTGGNVHFSMDNPQFYDFVNTRPGGGRVFSLGTSATNTFTATNSDISVWRRGVNVWNEDPDQHWTLIDFRLTGAHLRTITQVSPDRPAYPDFVTYYNMSPLNSRRMENFTRISGNNSRPIVNEALDLTNADRHVRALAETPQGRIRDSRPVWTNELWGNFTHTCALTGRTEAITSNTLPLGSLVRSNFHEELYEVETGVKAVAGTLKMTHNDGRFLRAGDLYRIDSAWRSSSPDLPRNHAASNIPPAFEFAEVRDVLPPVPVNIRYPVVAIDQTKFEGTWSLEDEFDDGPSTETSEGIRLWAQSGTDPIREITGLGWVSEDNTWTFTADGDQLFARDVVWVSLADTQENPNWNPLQPTPVRDRMIPEASWFIVAADGTLPVIVQNFYEGVEDISYRHVSHDLSFPNPGDVRTVNIGTGTSTDVHIYTPARDRRGYIVDRIELQAPGGAAIENIAIGPNGRPLVPIEVSPGNTVIHVHYILDPEYRSDIPVEFRFADFGGTNLDSLTLQAAVPYNLIRTGTFNQTGENRFPRMGIGDFHITETLTQANVESLVNALFMEGLDPDGNPIPPAIDGLPRGFTPSSEDFIQLPTAGSGTTGAQLTFPVSMIDLEASRVSAAPGAANSPIIINYVATLEELTIGKEVERCPDLGGDAAQLGTFDNMSFNYQLVLSRGPVGGVSNTHSAIAWTDHRLRVSIDTERAEADEDTGFLPDWAEYYARTWHGGATSLSGAIRIGSWNGGTAGTGDAGNNTATVAFTHSRRTGAEDRITISNIPSTAFIEVTQQVDHRPAGSSATNANAAWLNASIRDRHERDFYDSFTAQNYLWPYAENHVSTLAGFAGLTGANTHTTNWANPLPTDSNSSYSPGRPMDNSSREFNFRLIPQNGFMITVTNQVSGDGMDANRARNFNIQLRDSNGTYVAAERVLMLFVGEYEDIQVGTDPGTNESIYEQRPVLTPVEVGANGIVEAGLPALLPGESFTLMRLGGMYTARISMIDFPGYEAYEVRSHYLREAEGLPSEVIDGMTSDIASLNRDHLEITFESYRAWVVPAGLVAGSTGLSVIGLIAAGVAAVIFSMRRRREIEGLARTPKEGIDVVTI